jgi:hypothetical protein
MSSNPKKSPRRSPGSKPRSPVSKPKTPTIKSIGDGMSVSLQAVKDALPAGGISTLGMKPEDVQVLIDYPNILRGVLLIGAIATYVICLVLFSYGHSESNIQQAAAYPEKMPYYVYKPWFAIVFLTLSIGGLIYVLLSVNYFSFFFFVAAIAYYFSMVLAFVKFYYDVAIKSPASQIFGFILFVSVVLLGMIVTQATNNFIFAFAALIPSAVLAGYFIYCGGILNGNNPITVS